MLGRQCYSSTICEPVYIPVLDGGGGGGMHVFTGV